MPFTPNTITFCVDRESDVMHIVFKRKEGGNKWSGFKYKTYKFRTTPGELYKILTESYKK